MKTLGYLLCLLSIYLLLITGFNWAKSDFTLRRQPLALACAVGDDACLRQSRGTFPLGGFVVSLGLLGVSVYLIRRPSANH